MFISNLLAISSYQSKKIRSYDDVITNFINAKKTQDSTLCPSYWGGFSFTPYSFEFWEGHKSRINKRYAFNKTNNKWNWFILQP